MTARTIQLGESLERVWEELCFTQAALLTRPLTAPLASSVEPLIERAILLRQEQWRLWQAEAGAQAGIVEVNYMLDGVVQDISEAKVDALREENPGWRDKQAKASKEYEAYFPDTPYAIIRLAPETQLPQMRPWLKQLSSESSASLQGMLARLEKALQEGDAAVAKREDAQASTALHRLRRIEVFIGEVNAFRTNLLADLLKLSQANRLAKTWVSLFFRPTPQTPPPTEEARGMSRALAIVLSSRGLALSEAQQKMLAKTTDLELLATWLSRASGASSVDELFSV